MLQSTRKKFFINLIRTQLRKLIKDEEQLILINSVLDAISRTSNLKEMLNVIIHRLENKYPNEFSTKIVQDTVSRLNSAEFASNEDILNIFLNLLKIINPAINVDVLKDYCPLILSLVDNDNHDQLNQKDSSNANNSGLDITKDEDVTNQSNDYPTLESKINNHDDYIF